MRKKEWLAIFLLASLGLVAQADITTTVGASADTWIENATATHGSDDYMNITGPYSGGDENIYFMGYVRFDLSGLHIDTLSSATLMLVYYPRPGGVNNYNLSMDFTPLPGGGNDYTRFALQGLNNVSGNTPQSWDEATLNQSNTGAEVDWPANTGQLISGRFTDLDGNVAGITEICTWHEPFKTNNDYSGPGNSTATVSGPTLVAFLNDRCDDNGLVTFIISGVRGYGLGTKENTTVPYENATFETYGPVLTLTYTSGGAANPDPADGARVNRNTLTELRWTLSNPDSGDIGKCDVYLGTEPNIVTMDKLSFTPAVESVNINTFPSYSVLPLAEGVYYWRVDCYNDPNMTGNLPDLPNLPGPYWSFTATSAPVITWQTTPAYQAKSPTETAEFSIIVDSITDVTYTWYRSVDNANNTDPDTPVGDDSATLTLPNLTTADAGYYYCKAVNSDGEARSNPARLSIKQLYAYWALDGNANDSSDNALHGTLFGEPGFAAGIEDPNQAMVFDGIDDYIDMPDGFSDFAPGVTISVWAKPTAAGANARFIDFGNLTGTTYSDIINLGRNGTTTNLRFTVYAGTTATTVTATDVITLNEWQMFVATMNESGRVVLYRNGLPVQTETIALQPSIATRTSNFIGKSNWTADAMYAGLMDDIYLYNYAISEDDVADRYSHVVGNFCRTKPPYDLTGDCQTTMADFAMFAAKWMECGMSPVCP